MRRRILGLTLMGLLLGAAPVGAGWSLTLDVTMYQGQPYILLTQMIRQLGLTYQISPEPRSLLLTYGGREVSITNGPVMVISEQLIPLSTRPYWQGGDLWVPLDAVQKIFYVRVNWRVRTQEATFTTEHEAPPPR
ncbi:stalk domain-containing protein [Anthocerotibacter panamensis]|uniref:stalk domain-containing protein n=1 Tax=Anthocerotibacter panamensis TaxID=2857077 RepID=UPI001C408166|nr:stalk domain-containing protein [Anthocerotibacter panamensis]